MSLRKNIRMAEDILSSQLRNKIRIMEDQIKSMLQSDDAEVSDIACLSRKQKEVQELLEAVENRDTAVPEMMALLNV